MRILGLVLVVVVSILATACGEASVGSAPAAPFNMSNVEWGKLDSTGTFVVGKAPGDYQDFILNEDHLVGQRIGVRGYLSFEAMAETFNGVEIYPSEFAQVRLYPAAATFTVPIVLVSKDKLSTLDLPSAGEISKTRVMLVGTVKEAKKYNTSRLYIEFEEIRPA